MSSQQHSENNKPTNTSGGGILRDSETTTNTKSNSDKKKRVRLHWDEENLQRNETEREPRMTIAEPKTPYHLSDRSDSDSEASADRCSSLQGQETRHWSLEVAVSRAGNCNLPLEDGGYSSNSSQSTTPRSLRSSRQEFERKRKFHYDEFRISKYFRERGDLYLDTRHREEDEVEEEEEEERMDREREEVEEEEEDSLPYSYKSTIESEPVSPESDKGS